MRNPFVRVPWMIRNDVSYLRTCPLKSANCSLATSANGRPLSAAALAIFFARLEIPCRSYVSATSRSFASETTHPSKAMECWSRFHSSQSISILSSPAKNLHSLLYESAHERPFWHLSACCLVALSRHGRSLSIWNLYREIRIVLPHRQKLGNAIADPPTPRLTTVAGSAAYPSAIRDGRNAVVADQLDAVSGLQPQRYVC